MSFHNLLEQFYNNIFIFNNTKILVLFDKNNTIWMSYNSILKALGYNDIKKLKKRIDIKNEYFSTYEEIHKQSDLNKIKINYQKPNEKFINESGIYLLLSKSSKDIAKKLSEKLFVDVLPELRKTGKFILNSNEKKDMKKLTKRIKTLDYELNRTKKQSFNNKTGKGFIYVLKVKTQHNGQEKDCYKIGYTANLEKRMATYKTGNPDIKLEHHENINCNKKQLEKCIISLNILKLLKNKTEIICDVPLEKIKDEIDECKKLIHKFNN
jgi:prophage antirepressor-like protein